MPLPTVRLISRLAAATAAMALGGTVLATATPASAASRDGICDTGEFCYYFNSNNQGSVSDFTASIDDYNTTQPTCYDFKGAGEGKGKCIKNAAASVWNRSSKPVRVYFNSGYTGTYQDFAAGAPTCRSRCTRSAAAVSPAASTDTQPPPAGTKASTSPAAWVRVFTPWWRASSSTSHAPLIDFAGLCSGLHLFPHSVHRTHSLANRR